MKISHNEKSMKEYQESFRGKKNLPESQIRVLDLIWGLIRILFRHGNQKIFYHLCGQGDTWEHPMEAEGIGVRMTQLGKKVTLW
jgi:hypothetical protein